MSTILYGTSFGSDDPTRATLPFVAALEVRHRLAHGRLRYVEFVRRTAEAAFFDDGAEDSNFVPLDLHRLSSRMQRLALPSSRLRPSTPGDTNSLISVAND